MQPLAEAQRHLGKSERPGGGREQVEQDLEPLAGQRAHRRGKGVALDHEEPAHGVGQIGLDDEPAQPAGDIADDNPRALPIADAAGISVAAGDDDIEALRPDLRQHLRQQRFVVLKIAVHDSNIRRSARQDAFDTGGREAAAAQPLHTAEITLEPRQRAHDIGGSVGRVVIDKDRFPADAGERAGEALDQRCDIVAPR